MARAEVGNNVLMGLVRETLAERYDLLEVLGRGGMGVVYRGHDRVLSRTVAVKLLPHERADDPVWVARLAREARSAAALSHPNIVSVFDTGAQAGTHFIVMEYLDGRNLAQVARDRGRGTLDEAVRISSQIAAALGAAHRAGIVHRDIKPTNVMVDRSGVAKVLDFGIARASDSTTLTQTAVVVGSAPYLAPEVARGERADHRSDIYSLGCVLYELLTGGPPFMADTPLAILHQHNTVPPRPPRELAPEVPAALDALVVRMLAKQPGGRPQSARGLVGELESSLHHRDAPPGTRSARTRGLALAGVAATLLAVLLVVLLLGLSGSRPRQPGAAAGRAIAIAGHRLTTPRHRAAAPVAAQTSTKPAPPARTTPRSTRTPAAPPPTVAQAAGALTTLITQDLQSGLIDQHGQDLLNHLQDVLKAYEQGNTSDAVHKLGDLTNEVGQLAQHGDIKPSAVGAINVRVNSLRAAIVRSGPVASGSSKPPKQPPPKPPPGH